MSENSEKEILYEGKHVRLICEDGWEYLDRANSEVAAVVIPVTDDGKVVFVEQMRIPVGGPVIEFPAGLVGDVEGHEREEIVSAAKRELFEETGYEAMYWELLAQGPPSPGLSSEQVYFYMATGLAWKGPGGGDAGESIVVHDVAYGEIEDWLETMRLLKRQVDPKIFAGLYFLQRRHRQK